MVVKQSWAFKQTMKVSSRHLQLIVMVTITPIRIQNHAAFASASENLMSTIEHDMVRTVNSL